MADVSAFTSSEGASFSGREDRHRETSFSATELMFIKAFLSTFHSCRMHCNHKRERSLMMFNLRGRMGGSEMTPKKRILEGKNRKLEGMWKTKIVKNRRTSLMDDLKEGGERNYSIREKIIW